MPLPPSFFWRARRASPAPAVLVVTALLSGAAAAQQTSLHGVADVTMAFDSNVRNDGSGASADVSLTQSHGLMLFHTMERGQLSASWTRSFVFFIRNGGLSSDADRGVLNFAWALSDVDDIGLTVGLDRRSTNFISLDDPSATTAAAQPSNPVELISPSLSQRYAHAINERWSFEQTAAGSITRPLERTDELATLTTAGGTLGPTVELESHWLSFQGEFTHYYLTRIPVTAATLATGVDPAELDQPLHFYLPGGSVTWGWRFAEQWDSRVTGGAVVPINPERSTEVVPQVRLSTLYTEDQYGASLVLSRAISPSLLTQQIFLTHSGILSAYIPILVEENLYGEGAMGIAHNQLYTLDDRIDIQATAWSTDVGVRWMPADTPVTLSARYQLMVQFGAPDDTPLLQNFTRNVVSVTAGFFLPELDPAVGLQSPFQPADRQLPGGRQINPQRGGGQQPQQQGGQPAR